MGVPRLFPWFLDHYPQYVKAIQEGVHVMDMDAVYLDGNAILHGAAQRVYNYGPLKAMLMDPYAELTEDEKRAKTYEIFFEMLVAITKVVRPRDLLFIALDGTAPIAKQNQQRQRRFVSAMRQQEEATEGETPRPSISNQITPGTQFMVELSEYMRFHIRREMGIPTSPWHNIQVIYSPPSTPSEGEQKLLAHIRKMEAENKHRSYSHCIYGPDADLLILSMTSYAREIYWLRQNMKAPGFYEMVQLGDMGRQLGEYFGLNEVMTLQEGETMTELAIDQFAFISYFVGNDFLPRIQMFWALEQGLNDTLEIMRDQIRKYGDRGLLVRHGALVASGLRFLLDTFSQREQAYLTTQAIDPHKQSSDPKFKNHTLMNTLVMVDGAQTVDMDLYRDAYYDKAGVDSEEEIQEMSMAYLKTMYWIYLYYTESNPSWTWSYPYHYAPLMMDLYRLVYELKTKEEWYPIIDFDLAQPFHPFQQLLSVLPPSDASYLPEAYRWWMTDPKSILVTEGYYPTSFSLDCEGKFEDHQCIPLIPFIDNELMGQVHQEVIQTLDSDEVNALTQYHIRYQYDPHRKVNYSNMFGRLEGTHIQREYISP